MRKTRALLAGVISSLVAPGSILEAGRYPSLKGTDLARMRGDVARVGVDFYQVIQRENGQTSNRPATKTTARK